jgi:hypothetical protein
MLCCRNNSHNQLLLAGQAITVQLLGESRWAWLLLVGHQKDTVLL